MSIRRVSGLVVSEQFLKFCLVGSESTVLNYLVFLVFLSFFGVNYLLAAALGFISGVFFGFIFNRGFTFRSHVSKSSSLPKYLLIYFLTLIINVSLLKFFVESSLFTPVIANLILMPPIIVLNFLGTKIIAFEDKRW